MKLTTKLSFIAAGLMIFNSAQASNKTFINCVSRAPSSFSPALVMEGISYNASSQQVYNRLIEFKRDRPISNLRWQKVGKLAMTD